MKNTYGSALALTIFGESHGAAIGAVNGVCFGILLCWALQFAGPVIGRDTLAHTALAKALQAIDVLTLGVGV